MKKLLFLIIILLSLTAKSQCDPTFTYSHIDCDSVWFVPNSIGSQYVYFWDFGDGNTSMDDTPVNVYSSNGSYTVVLTLQDTVANCFQAYTAVVNINCSATCTTDGDWVHTSDSANCNTQFTSTAFGGIAPYTYYWDFGDGNTSTSSAPSHSYPYPNTWNTCLTITDATGCDTTICYPVTAGCNQNSCDAQFTYTYASCDSIWFVPISQGAQYVYLWDFGDGSSSTGMYPSHQYASDGQYFVVLSISDTVSGCTEAYTVLVDIDCGSNCNVNGDYAWSLDTINCEVDFVSTAYGGTAPYTFHWNFSDGTTSNQPHPTHQYPNNSVYTPVLTITDANGCDTTIYYQVNVNCSAPSCDAIFTANFTGCDSVQFVSNSYGAQFTYFWDFGDGNYSTAPQPTHTYNSDGIYQVWLLVQDSLATCADSSMIMITVNCNYSPCTMNGAFAWNVDSTNCSTQFVSTAYGGTPPYQYSWNFGDGGTSTLPNPTHQYPNNSIWTPCLTITDANGCDTVICDVVTVNCNPQPCDASFTHSFIGCDSVWFVPNSQGTQYDYYWDFGDGTYSTSMWPSHQYSANGQYLVVLTLIDSVAGCAQSYTVPITVNCPTQCTTNGAISWYVDSSNCNVNFVSTAFGGTPPYTYAWAFGDGGTSNSPNPTHQYPNNSTWTPCLTITDATGCDTTICDVVNVQCNPSPCTAEFTASYAGCDSLFFYPVANNGPVFYSWDFGDGSFSTAQNPTHQYGSDGTYYVILSIYDSAQMCSDVYTLPVVIDCANSCTVNGAATAYADSTCNVDFAVSAWGGSAPYTYFWAFGDGGFSNQQNPTHQYPSGGAWTPCVTITDANGCDTMICIVVTPICSTNIIEENMDELHMNVYPNPAKGLVNVTVEQEGTLFVYDMSGKLISSETVGKDTQHYIVDLSNQKSGIYILRFAGIKDSQSIRLVKY